MKKRITVSLISHGQYSLAKHVLDDLQDYCADEIVEVILTINVAEAVSLPSEHFSFPIRVLRNPGPKGFGANHNAAFRQAKGDFFCVLNPDIRLTDNPFPDLVELAERERVGVVAPWVCNGAGEREDSARSFPTLRELLGKLLGGKSAAVPDSAGLSAPDWVAGMFMLFPTSVFREMNGFDERYFLYYEDVDLCARLALAGYKRLVCPDVRVVHEARRSSHRDVRYAWMHLQSILRFFSSDVYRQVRRLRHG
jgi:GT2 family glycosyltransferase